MKIYDNGKTAEGLTPEEAALYEETMKRLGRRGQGEGFGKAVATLAKEIQEYRQKIAKLTEQLEMKIDDIVEMKEENQKLKERLQELQRVDETQPVLLPHVETMKPEEGVTVITIRTEQPIDNIDVYFKAEGER